MEFFKKDFEGRPLTPWQRRLLVVCMPVFIWSALVLAAGIFMSVTKNTSSPLPLLLGSQGQDLDAGLTVAFAAGTLLASILGMYGARNPSRIGPFFWIATADAVLTAWAVASSLSAGTANFASLVTLCIIAIPTVCAWHVRALTGWFDHHPHPGDDNAKAKDSNAN